MSIVNNSIIRSNLNLNSISGSIGATRRSISDANNSVDRISKNVSYNTRTRQELFNRSMILQSRRIEASKRQEVEDQVESSKVSIDPKRGLLFSSKSEQGPFGRLMSFLGFITAGWMVENLPTWTFMGKEFISRIYKFGNYVPMMIQDFMYTIKNFGGILSKSLSAIVRLDFKEFSEGSVRDSFEDLKVSIENLGNDITSAFGLFKEPLTTSLDTGEQAPGLGDIRPDSIPGTTTTSGVGTKEQQALLKAIRFAEGTTSSYGVISGGDIVPELAGGKMTVKEVIDMGNTSRLPSRFGGRRVNYKWSGATGAYQFMPDTLKGLVNSGVVYSNELLTPKKQDELAIYLAERRGVSKDILKEEGFSTRVSDLLAPEWASFPYSLNGGRSYYGQSYKPLGQLQSIYNTELSKTNTELISQQASTGNIKPLIGDRLGAGRNHKGVDLLVNSGTPIRAISDGVIVDSDFDKDGWGNFLVMKDNLGVYHLYGHMQSGNRKSGVVKKGEIIGKVGMSGHTTGPHLHWEAGTGWNGYQLTGRFDALTKYNKEAPFNTSMDSKASQAQITPPPTPQPPQPPSQQSTQNVVIIDDSTPTPSPVIQSTSSESTYTSTISEFKLLNNFIKNKLLLDLAYL